MNAGATNLRIETAHGPPLDRRDAARLALMDALGELEDRTRDVLGEIARLRMIAADGADAARMRDAAYLWFAWRIDLAGPTSATYRDARGRVAAALGEWRAACRAAEGDGR